MSQVSYINNRLQISCLMTIQRPDTATIDGSAWTVSSGQSQYETDRRIALSNLSRGTVPCQRHCYHLLSTRDFIFLKTLGPLEAWFLCA
jgi:hypothetical protein